MNNKTSDSGSSGNSRSSSIDSLIPGAADICAYIVLYYVV